MKGVSQDWGGVGHSTSLSLSLPLFKMGITSVVVQRPPGCESCLLPHPPHPPRHLALISDKLLHSPYRNFPHLQDGIITVPPDGPVGRSKDVNTYINA